MLHIVYRIGRGKRGGSMSYVVYRILYEMRGIALSVSFFIQNTIYHILNTVTSGF